MTKSYKAIQIWVDMYDNCHTLFIFKYIIFFLQIIKTTFNLLNTFRTYELCVSIILSRVLTQQPMRKYEKQNVLN
ncbi:hypothetical protein [Flavobacterium faecale]|uniref:hypothetical protein n=1 Tax=Flavobacterium faecale TaxID=1355330 RepID=UPI003AAD4701